MRVKFFHLHKAKKKKEILTLFFFSSIFVHFESLLSTIGVELGILGDMEYCIRFLNRRIFIEVNFN